MADVKNVPVDVDPDDCKEDGGGINAWWEDRSLPQKILLGILFAIGGIALLAVFGLFVMLLWNWLMPEIFGLKQLNYWQAWGLLVLSWILFKGFGSSSSTSSSGSAERKRKWQLRRYMRERQASAGEESAGSSQA
jgi:hypothetical protein